MNVYRILGDAVATIDARALAEQLVAWHDAMVNHLRAVNMRRARCHDGCPHEQARTLWTEAVHIFNEEAGKLTFLRRHGQRSIHAAAELVPEARV